MKKDEARAAYTALMKVYPFALEDLDGEEWRPIDGYEDYQISSFGRVKSLKYKFAQILKPYSKESGYMWINLCKNGQVKKGFIHRLVAQAFIPNTESKPQINHIDGHPLNNHVSNLEWVTAAENTRHAFKTGLCEQGADRSEAKLTKEQVIEARKNFIPYDSEFGSAALARKMNVSQTIMSLLLSGKTYKNIEGVHHTKKQPLNEEQRQEIRRIYVKGDRTFGGRSLARKYGVSSETIRAIVREEKNK